MGRGLNSCFNPLLAEDRQRTREELLAATEKALGKIAREVARRTRTPLTQDAIGVKVGNVIDRHNVGRHFKLTIEDGRFTYVVFTDPSPVYKRSLELLRLKT
jgi:electron transfer flavoprotein alpha subunit